MKKNPFKTKSFLRREEYKALSHLSIDGAILDVGGSKKSGYHELIGGTHTILTGNIDTSYGTDIVFNAEETWPAKEGEFNGVLFINLLEHLYHYEVAMKEAYRVLSVGGTLVGVVPFMLNIHGTPHDHFRFTKTTLERMCKDLGFTSVYVEPLGTGVFSVVYQTLLGFFRWQWLAMLGIATARGMDGLLSRIKPDNKMSREYMPLGYFFTAVK